MNTLLRWPIYYIVLWAAFLGVALGLATHGTDGITEHGIAIQSVNPCEDCEAECERLRAALVVYTEGKK